MRSPAGVVLVLLAACSPGGEVRITAVVPTVTTLATTTTSAAPLPACPSASYDLTYLPEGVGGSAAVDLDFLEPDVWTSVPGSNTSFYPHEEGGLAIALIRGTLPALDWPGERGEVSIDGTRAVVGPHDDGTWVAGWFEAPGERCDQYTMVFYPPWDPSEVEQVLLGMDRVGG